MSDKERFEGWAVVELLGHRRLGGYVRDVEMFGGRMLRLDIPGPKAESGKEDAPVLMVSDVPNRVIEDSEYWAATQFYGVGSIYCLTPTTADVAIAAAKANQPSPVQRWEMPAIASRPDRDIDDCDDGDDGGMPY